MGTVTNVVSAGAGGGVPPDLFPLLLGRIQDLELQLSQQQQMAARRLGELEADRLADSTRAHRLAGKNQNLVEQVSQQGQRLAQVEQLRAEDLVQLQAREREVEALRRQVEEGNRRGALLFDQLQALQRRNDALAAQVAEQRGQIVQLQALLLENQQQLAQLIEELRSQRSSNPLQAAANTVVDFVRGNRFLRNSASLFFPSLGRPPERS